MKASVQYNDFLGTSAADISDFTTLNRFLQSRGVNNVRYNAIGAEFNSGYKDYFSASIICIDKDLSKDEKLHIVKFRFQNEISNSEFFDLFKGFNVVITERSFEYENSEIDENITIDDREIEKILLLR